MEFFYLKSLHIIFVITWFAGLFYIVRLFIYHAESELRPSPEKEILQKQYKIMSQRLWYMITWPSAILATLFAGWMLYLTPSYLSAPWMILKLGFVLALFIYHWCCQIIYSQLQNDEIKFSSFQLRIWNEVATIILFATVFIVVLKDTLNWIWGIVGVVLFSAILMLGIKLYKRIRDNKKL